MVEPNYLPGRERRWFARIGRCRAAPMAKGHIARFKVFPRCFVQYRGISVRLWKVLGTSLQKGNINSETLWLNLVKSLKNRREIGKLQTQFF
jgi:hypothetical protein